MGPGGVRGSIVERILVFNSWQRGHLCLRHCPRGGLFALGGGWCLLGARG